MALRYITSGGNNQTSVNMKFQCLFTIVFSKLLSHVDRISANTLRNNNVVITSRRRHFDVITSKWRRSDVITTSLLRHIFRGLAYHLGSLSIMAYAWKYSPTVNLYSLNETDGCLTARSHEVSKPRDSGSGFSNRSKIWQAPRLPRCRGAYQISEQYNHRNNPSHDFETLRILSVNRLIPYWIELGPEWQETRVSPETK